MPTPRVPRKKKVSKEEKDNLKICECKYCSNVIRPFTIKAEYQEIIKDMIPKIMKHTVSLQEQRKRVEYFVDGEWKYETPEEWRWKRVDEIHSQNFDLNNPYLKKYD